MADLTLPRGEIKVLQAEDKDYKRGLLVRLLKNGGYDMAYWFKKPDKAYPVEVLVDGKSIKKDAKVVEMKFHPQDYYDKNEMLNKPNYIRNVSPTPANQKDGEHQYYNPDVKKRTKRETTMNLKSLVKETIKEVVAERVEEKSLIV